MKFNWKSLESKLAAGAFRVIQRWLSKKSLLGSEKTGAFLGRMVFRLSKKNREKAMRNLRLAFPEWTDQQRLATVKGCLEHFGIVMSDFMRSKSRSRNEVLESIEVEGLEHIDQALADGKGVVLITGHFGNWERMANWYTVKGYPLTVVARDANDPNMNVLVTELREAAGLEVISRGDAARAVLSGLRKNRVIGILPDQNSEEIFVPFFGKLCGTVTGPAVLSHRAKAPVITTFCHRVGPGKYKLVISEPLAAVEGFEHTEGMTRAINNALEAAIRQHPNQYLWLHDRWKAARVRGLI